MLLVKRVFVWVCSNCGKTEELLGYGLPKGWVYRTPKILDKNKEIKHYCAKCVKENK